MPSWGGGEMKTECGFAVASLLRQSPWGSWIIKGN